MDAWSTQFDRTWLRSARAARALDEKIAQLVGGHWRRPAQASTPLLVLPLRCEQSAALLADAGKSPSNAIHCTVLLTLIGELLLCAESGGILRDSTVASFAGGDCDCKVNAEAMRRLRNAVCHPASVTEDDGEIAIVSLSTYVEANHPEETWGPSLRTQPAQLAERDVAFFAIRLVNNIGWWQAARWGVTLRGAKSPLPLRR